MTNKELAQVTHKAFKLLLRKTSTEATHGNKKSALDLIGYMTAMNIMLHDLGYDTNDEGKLIKYKPKPQTEQDQLIKLACLGDQEAAKKLLKSFIKK